ncbi:MAG: ATPase, T2SS/T4P/T4SS family [Candidatus Omnitrophota bacterium]|nr:ATPase, T2SS/T4P/T4SS family [Candidatus Omnitrophota bacterium]
MISQISKTQLAEMLIDSGKVDAKEFQNVLKLAKKDKKDVFELVVEKGLIDEEDMTHFLSDHLEIPMFNLSAYRIPKDTLDLIPKKLADRYRAMPVSRIKNLLTVATSRPLDLMLQDDLRGLTNCDISLILATPKAISAAVEHYYSQGGSLHEIIEGIGEDDLEVVADRGAKEGDDDTKKHSLDDAPVIRMVNLIIEEAIRMRASDIHFEPYEKEFRIRYRIDGALKDAFSHARDMYSAVVARIKIMSQLDITEKRVPQDGRFRVKLLNREIDFRVSMLPIYFGEKIVMRVLDRASMKSGLDKLGLTEGPTNILARAVKHPYGMILVTGPTGSGKSTTLYTILNTLNTIDRNIMTIEDPVEYQVEGITQTQTHAQIGLTFASGLRALLRQSPDIVLVGEIRDSETADIAVKAALTGHLVFSTLHTNSAAGAVTRLIDMGVEPFLIASSVICVAAQRLVRRVCQYCKAPHEVPAEVLRRCNLTAEDMKGFTPYKGKGCVKCNHTGYYGRMAVIELMEVDNQIREMIIEKLSSDQIHRAAVEKGMETLYEYALGRFKAGCTTLEEVLRVSSD